MRFQSENTVLDGGFNIRLNMLLACTQINTLVITPKTSTKNFYLLSLEFILLLLLDQYA